jgi:hypothetical protein
MKSFKAIKKTFSYLSIVTILTFGLQNKPFAQNIDDGPDDSDSALTQPLYFSLNKVGSDTCVTLLSGDEHLPMPYASAISLVQSPTYHEKLDQLKTQGPAPVLRTIWNNVRGSIKNYLADDKYAHRPVESRFLIDPSDLTATLNTPKTYMLFDEVRITYYRRHIDGSEQNQQMAIKSREWLEAGIDSRPLMQNEKGEWVVAETFSERTTVRTGSVASDVTLYWPVAKVELVRYQNKERTAHEKLAAITSDGYLFGEDDYRNTFFPNDRVYSIMYFDQFAEIYGGKQVTHVPIVKYAKGIFFRTKDRDAFLTLDGRIIYPRDRIFRKPENATYPVILDARVVQMREADRNKYKGDSRVQTINRLLELAFENYGITWGQLTRTEIFDYNKKLDGELTTDAILKWRNEVAKLPAGDQKLIVLSHDQAGYSSIDFVSPEYLRPKGFSENEYWFYGQRYLDLVNQRGGFDDNNIKPEFSLIVPPILFSDVLRARAIEDTPYPGDY